MLNGNDMITDEKADFFMTTAAPPLPFPRRPWVLSKQYAMTFILSTENEIILGDSACKYLGDDVLRHIIAAVNSYKPEISK